MKRSLFVGAARKAVLLLSAMLMSLSCVQPVGTSQPEDASMTLSLQEIARMISELPLEEEHLEEVHAAVTSSSEYGYDEEYTLHNLLTAPGAGVGYDKVLTKAAVKSYSNPVRNLVEDYLSKHYSTKAAGGQSVRALMDELEASDAQIYWPYADKWDGESMPIVTFYPGADAESVVGYEMVSEDGASYVRQVTVDERTAMERPVWVLNNNDDSSYESIEVRRLNDPNWGMGGGISVKSGAASSSRTLYLKNFTMKRHYDCWLRGGSEFFVKCGYVADFTATTEAELKLYHPTVTDFMISVPRRMLGQKMDFGAVLITDWTDQLDKVAFMITEDDGGTITSWKTEATVKIQSKSYGVSINIPVNNYDDIVWRGQLSTRYFEKYNDKVGAFGDVAITFHIE